MFKRIFAVLILSLMINSAYAGNTPPTFDFATALAAEGATIDTVIAAALTAGVDINTIASSLSASGHSADAIVFAMVSAGADADSVVNATVAAVPGTTAEALATTLVEAKINYNARVSAGEVTGDTITVDTTTTSPRTSFTAARSSGGGSPLSTQEYINVTSSS